jgi:hypothetical protein
MDDRHSMAEMSARERREFCSRVIEELSDLVEGSASREFAARVEACLGAEIGYRTLCRTLVDTIGLAAECGECGDRLIDEASFQHCVERARQRLKGET